MYMEILKCLFYLDFVLVYLKYEKGISLEFSSFMIDFFFVKFNVFKGYVWLFCIFENINENIF